MSKSVKLLVGIILIVIAAAIVLFFKPHAAPQASVKGPTTTYNLSPITSTTIFLAGDIMLSRNVAAKMYQAKDFTLPFKNILAETSIADLAFANLESPFNHTGIHFIPNSLNFNADPQAVSGLTAAGFDILSTANNHSLDQGQDALDFTYNILKQNNILPIGTTTTCHQGQIIKRHDLKFGFLAYSYTAINNGTQTPDPTVCDANNLPQVALDIQNLKPQVDVLLVSMHMGIEYTRHPTQAQVDFAHSAIDSGADFVVGAHPHWIQDVENYNGKYIFYSLGNFVFDQMWSTETRQGLTVKLIYTNKQLSKIELNPIIIDNYCCPRFANPNETKSILDAINLTSPILVPHN